LASSRRPQSVDCRITSSSLSESEVAASRAEIGRLWTTGRKLTVFCKESPFLQSLSDRFKDEASRITGEPMEMMVDNAILESGSAAHQDLALLDVSPEAHILGVWIAIDAATRENGCVWVSPCASPQYHSSDISVTPRFHIEDFPGPREYLEMSPGQVAVWDGLCVHGSDKKPGPRWSLQFHYKPHGMSEDYRPQRIAAFRERMIDAS
jgi:ectoine hydroxylase-related dioxygenase (phytanoyl-CoA dioxygenase family)